MTLHALACPIHTKKHFNKTKSEKTIERLIFLTLGFIKVFFVVSMLLYSIL